MHSAEILLAVTNSDEANLMADIISSSTKKLARLRDADYDGYHDNFREPAPAIDTVINPEIEVVKTIDRLMRVPGAVDVAEFADVHHRDRAGRQPAAICSQFHFAAYLPRKGHLCHIDQRGAGSGHGSGGPGNI